MQTPFKLVAHTIRENELTNGDTDKRRLNTNLLFDFFEVFISLGTITIFIVHVIRFTLWMKTNGLSLLSESLTGPFSIFSIFQYGKQWRFGGRGGWLFQRIHVITMWWLGPGFCIVIFVMTTFVKGMLVDAQDAWDTARYLFATYGGGGGVLIIVYWVAYKWLKRKRLSA